MPDASQTVLVVESNAALANMIQTGLEKAGFAVVVAEDGRAAWEKLESGSFSAVVTDYSMRDSVGTEICRGLRYNDKYATTPIVVTAAAGDVDLTQLGDELKLAGALKKPISVRELVAKMQAALAAPVEPPAATPSPTPAVEEPDAPATDAAEE